MNNWQANNLGIFEYGESSVVSYPEIGNDLCFAVENNSPWFNQRNELLLHFLKKHKITGDFLDIGGGNGYQSKALADSGHQGKVILCEPGVKGCLNAKKRGVELVYQGTFQQFPFNEYKIKNCGLFDVIEHIEDDITFLNDLYNKIEAGTRIFINVPALKMLWSETDEIVGHYRRYDLEDVTRLASLTKFNLVEYTFYFDFYYWILYFLRVIPYKFGYRQGRERLLLKEQKNLKPKGVFDKYIGFMHKRSMQRLAKNNRIEKGTSLFIILEKQ